uniref:DNA-directed RNA polymerase subunit alpha n=1 Tax=Cyanidium caldarium TaxID=2771 RepID=RPOA_CYACA|nr:RNA polymerase alpha subunit [Cyanidium caldarium]Q9TLV2.1 RecName: Full=DNA-directed RNA polymerase subunit alpha; Short=PEP; AltName: Full=Plastid-encoded RNA polymerase subunit alpha; Short=RNA polymerase subunit alpha [Cyanidium caldarium]AAF12928.1 unknown [Cyanidium caldarium]WDB00291.1 RNA polymerase alpha subunit [Cyanidium caldarium]
MLGKVNGVQIECLESMVINSREIYGKFMIEPLSYGQAITVGNALRRVLLSDVPGVTIVSVRIAGINHEFSTVKGVKEDVLEILLNLKNIVLKGNVLKNQIGRLKVQGPAIVTSGQIEFPLDITVVDPCQYIATISGNDYLEMELKVEKSSGYKLVETFSKKSPLDFLPIDSIFMPVKKVNYYVEEILDSKVAYEKLILELWTNGSLSPQQSINYASDNLVKLFNPLRVLDFSKESSSVYEQNSLIKQKLIEELCLSVRAYNCLKRVQVDSIGDLLEYSIGDLLEIKNFGQKSVEEVSKALYKKFGVKLKH